MLSTSSAATISSRWLQKGNKQFELSNHLGNVLAVITDKAKDSVIGGVVDHYEPEMLNAQDYYPFGMLQPDRQWELGNYRYGFQSQEEDDEIKGDGNSINFKYRTYDPRIGRFFAIDPLTAKYPWNSPYAFSENKVIHAIELEGLEAHVLTQNYNKNGDFQSSSFIWDEKVSPVKNGQLHYIKNVGGKVTRSIADASDLDYDGGNIDPTPAPRSILGTTEYYTFRNNDFNLRQTLMDKWYTWQPDPPKYYMGYGDKYVKRFSKDLRPNLSSAGKEWLDQALINLQEAIEFKLISNPSIEVKNSAFQKFAFDSHVSAYENAGLFGLPISDLLQIGTTPDIGDLLSPNGLRQVKQVGIDYLRHAKENPIPTTLRILEFGLDMYQRFNKKDNDD